MLSTMRKWLLTVLINISVSSISCSAQQLQDSKTAAPSASPVPRFEHVFVVVEENQNYEEVIGNIKDLPYLNSLAANYGVAANYYANIHPSINNYFYLTAGRRGIGLLWIGELADEYPWQVAGDNIASILTANGKTWKAYAESLPQAGYVGDDRFPYAKRHNPFAYFESVRQSRADAGQAPQAANIVPFASFAGDLQQDKLPDYSFIVPNLFNDGHHNSNTGRKVTCGDHHALQTVDTWLKTNMQPLIGSATFKRGGLLVIVFDEGCEAGPHADSRYDPTRPGLKGGGHVPALIISSRTPAGTTSAELYHHESILRLSLRALGIERIPGLAATAPDMNAFFNSGQATPTVKTK
jgi:phosphatidylinositol-3-phosphatase